MQNSAQFDSEMGRFRRAIAPIAAGYSHSTFAVVAVRQDDTFTILNCRIRLAIAPSSIPFGHFRTENIFAAHYSVAYLGVTIDELIKILLSGRIELPDGELTMPPRESGGYGLQFQPLHEDGLRTQARLGVLTISGGETGNLFNQPELDWELKAAETPFDNLTELMFEYGLGLQVAEVATIHVIADQVAYLHSDSTMSGMTANVVIRLAKSLPTEGVSLGYRVAEEKKFITRESIHGSAMKWKVDGDFQRGEIALNVPAGSVVHTIVRYAGIALHTYWVSDPARAPNVMRTALSTFDPSLGSLSAIIEAANGRGQQARELESAVAWLLWLNGFHVAHLGGTQKVKIEGPDLIIMTPSSGNFGVVEVTTGHLGADKKLPNLIARAEQFRRQLDESGQGHRTILKVIVTTLRAAEVEAEREQAEKLGVVVVTRETLDEAIQRSVLIPDPERVYGDALQAVQDGLGRQTEPRLK